MVECPTLDDMPNALKIGEEYSYGHIVTYFCDIGTWIERSVLNLRSQCLVTGKWDVDPRPCVGEFVIKSYL